MTYPSNFGIFERPANNSSMVSTHYLMFFDKSEGDAAMQGANCTSGET